LLGLVLLAFTALQSAAQSYPSPWLGAVVGSVESSGVALPDARKVTSVSAVRALGDVSILINAPQVTAKKTFRRKRDDESSYDYIRAAVREALQGKLHLRIPRGVYAIKVPDSSRAGSHIQIKSAEDVLLDFQGSSLIFQDLNKLGFLLTDSRRVAIENATMWWSGISHVMGEIERSSTGPRIKIDRNYLPHVEQSTLLQQAINSVLPASIKFAHLWDLPNYTHEYHNPSQESEFVFSRETGSYIPKRAEILAPFKSGQSVLVQNKKFGANAFHVSGGSDVTIRGCTIGHTPGMALFSPIFERGLAWVDNKIAPISHPLHVTTTADGVHLRNMGGDFLIQGSTFTRTTDDPINVYGGLLEVIAVESETTFLLRPRLIKTDLRLLARGRQLLFVDHEVAPRGRASIVNIEPISKTLVRVVTARALPSVKPGDSVFTGESIARRGGIFGNIISDVRARAGIVFQGVSASIIGNDIRNTTGPAIIAGGFQNWYVEGPLVANTRIRDNLISKVGLAPFYRRFNLRGAISVGTGTKETSEIPAARGHKPHWGVAVVRNTIVDSAAPGIQVQDTHTTWIRGNVISQPSVKTLQDGALIQVNNVCDAQVRDNTLPGEPQVDSQPCE
jgi:hypothetical protein